MILRFVQGNDLVSKMIVAVAKTCMPFTPSHVEAVTPDGKYLGAHYNGGVQEREPGYDKAGATLELLLPLPATPEQDAKFYAYLHSRIGEPYDWRSISGFVLTGHHHELYHVICSALQGLALRECEWLPYPLPTPMHLVSPRDLLLLIGSRVRIPM